jgi:putative colanic acid biosynthesis acetyltransferase WcaB
VLVEWIFCLELHWKTSIGPGLVIHHGYSLVVHRDTVIGSGCILRQCTTLGVKTNPDGSEGGAPKICNNVDIGSNVVIIGPVKIGDGAIIGAGAVVVRDVPAGAVMVGNPAQPLNREKNSSD